MSDTCMTPAAFDALPMRQKAMLVAADVIAQIKMKRFKTSKGVYIDNIHIPVGMEDLSTASDEGKKLLHKSACTVCAKGAIFMSSIQMSNKMSLIDVKSIAMAHYDHNWSGVHNNPTNVRISKKITDVDRIFTRANLDMIEAAFEKDACFAKSESGASRDFGYRYEKSDVRLVAICMNILKHNGEFNPNGYKPKPSDVLRKIYGKTRKPPNVWA